MANKDGHRRFGNVRERASGRWQARYPGPDGLLRLHIAPTLGDKELSKVTTEVVRTWRA